jgi:cytochrome bd-type quinol oxidase subunit 2
MLFAIYYKNLKLTSIILSFILIGLLIGILVVNNNLNYYANNLEVNNFEDNLKIQKALIWINYSVILLFFLYLLIVSVEGYASNALRKNLTIKSISMIIIVTVLTYYMNKSLNDINISNSNEELKKIYIIIPILTLISIFLLIENFFTTRSNIYPRLQTWMNNYNYGF